MPWWMKEESATCKNVLQLICHSPRNVKRAAVCTYNRMSAN